jgi:hypothetical protein
LTLNIETGCTTFLTCTKRITTLKKPLVYLDEKPKQLLRDKRISIFIKPGNLEKYDYEYVRNGTADIFMAVEFKAGKWVTQVTKRRAMTDFAQFVKILVTRDYSEAQVIRIVTDNLNIHKEKSFYETFSEDEAKQILDKIEFHYTPKHASWLNAAEIEINVMDIECTNRRIRDMEHLHMKWVHGQRGGMKTRRKWNGNLRGRMPMRKCQSIM